MSSPLKPCRECGHEVSKSAKICPNCGVSKPGKGPLIIATLFKWTFMLGIIGIFLFIVLAGVMESSKTPEQKAVEATEQQARNDAYAEKANEREAASQDEVDAPASIKNLMTKEDGLNELCRGGSDDDPATEKSCEKRDTTLKELEKLGWCWGNDSQSGSDKAWQKCNN